MDHIIAKMQRSRIPVPGDGFCFLPSIVEALDKDHKISISVPQARQLILDFLLHNYEKYVDFFSCQMNPCQPTVSMSDALLSEMVQLFDNSLFNKNVVNLLVQLAADELNVNIFIFQDNSGEIQVLNYSCGEFGKKIYMKYSHNNRYSVGNHYEPLVKLKKLNRTVPWPSNLMKSNGTNNDEELPLNLSQSTQYATEAHVPEQSPVQLDVSSPIQLVYRKKSNCDKEIIYIQNMPMYENDSDQPTCYINTPDNANVNEDTEDKRLYPR